MSETELADVAKRNLRHFIGAASFKCEVDREAALHCLDTLEQEIGGLNDLVAVLRAYQAAEARLATPSTEPAPELVERVARAIHEHLSRRDIMQYLDNDEDCEGLARAVLTTLQEIPGGGQDAANYWFGEANRDHNSLVEAKEALEAIADGEGCHIDIARQTLDGIARREAATPPGQPLPIERMLNDLLAVIHRDGGHRQDEVGQEQAWMEAMMTVPFLLEAKDRLAEPVGDAELIERYKTAYDELRRYIYDKEPDRREKVIAKHAPHLQAADRLSQRQGDAGMVEALRLARTAIACQPRHTLGYDKVTSTGDPGSIRDRLLAKIDQALADTPNPSKEAGHG